MPVPNFTFYEDKSKNPNFGSYTGKLTMIIKEGFEREQPITLPQNYIDRNEELGIVRTPMREFMYLFPHSHFFEIFNFKRHDNDTHFIYMDGDKGFGYENFMIFCNLLPK